MDIVDQLPVAVVDQIVRQQEEIDRLRELLLEARRWLDDYYIITDEGRNLTDRIDAALKEGGE